jgi:hypothetical protein
VLRGCCPKIPIGLAEVMKFRRAASLRPIRRRDRPAALPESPLRAIVTDAGRAFETPIRPRERAQIDLTGQWSGYRSSMKTGEGEW